MPHGAEEKNLLKTAGAGTLSQLPRRSDEAGGGRAATHEPFKGGECLTCHDAHGTNIAGMIVKQDKLCFDATRNCGMP